MTRARRILTVIAALAAAVAMSATPATAARNCVAQINEVEREVYGTGWGHDVVGSLASDPSPLEGLGFAKFGDLAVYVALAPTDACPAEA